jgi:2-polyprenyl-3-methyl-5-hydroxy-6-metoxy-1,4-benzoquinol methylase
MDFIHRSYKSELLDQPAIPATDIVRNLYELEVINRWLGGHAVTRSGFKTLASDHQNITVCEIGCGGGDNLRAIQQNTRSRQAALHCIGIDLNPDCIRVAQTATWKKLPQFIISDYRKVVFDVKPDILFSSLFCHHFTEEQLVDMFSWMQINTRTGFFINDLHRHAFAYYAIRILTGIFSRSYLVKNDAPLSVLRGFKKKELKNILNKAGILHYTIKWKWAFRWLVIVPS